MHPAPSGTVTFLFTDIEGSTMRWERQPSAMQHALAGHDAILRHAIVEHGGHVFKTVGDAFYAAFATASDALAAALAAQRALAVEDWGDMGPLRVRMALHTGAVEARDGDYFGPTLNRVARLLSAGHGGQTLLSLAAQELVRDQLPADVTLRDLGERRLKDLIRPEHVFQLVVPDLPADFPPLRTLDTRPTNLPAQPTPLIGREREIAAVTVLLRRRDLRLVTLTGPGGTGKTRLGLQVAAEMVDEFADGVFFVNLAPISDPTLVISTIAQTLSITEAGGQPVEETLQSYLHDKQLLLVLDNFEQLLDAAPLVAAPKLKILVTSRSVLRLYGEYEYPVPPLALPDPKRLPSIERLTQYEAVRLFIERAQAVKADFHVTNATAPAVAEICVRLDGLPLAIELAAARVKLLPPPALLTRLESRLKLLTGGARNLPARQQTLRGAIDWSYSLLDPAEQMLFARLAVFSGRHTLEAIEAVCNADGTLPLDPFDGVASLVDKSLLRQEDGPDGEPHFIMLETIHEYARERLAASSEAETVRRQHALFFVALAEQVEPALFGSQQAVWLERLEAEHDNLRAALQWTLNCGEVEMVLRLSGGLCHFWWMRGHLSEGRRWLEAAVAASSAYATPLRAKVFFQAGGLAYCQGDYTRAAVLLQHSVALARALHDEQALAYALLTLGNVAAEQGEYARAVVLFEESLALMRTLDDTVGSSMLLTNLGWVVTNQGEYARATTLLEEGLALARARDDTHMIAACLTNVGLLALQQGDAAAALACLQESVALCHAASYTVGIVDNLEGVVGIAAADGQPERVARLLGTAEALRESIGAPRSPAGQAQVERVIAAARAQLDEAAWQAAWAEGRAMSLEQTIAYALENSQT